MMLLCQAIRTAGHDWVSATELRLGNSVISRERVRFPLVAEWLSDTPHRFKDRIVDIEIGLFAPRLSMQSSDNSKSAVKAEVWVQFPLIASSPILKWVRAVIWLISKSSDCTGFKHRLAWGGTTINHRCGGKRSEFPRLEWICLQLPACRMAGSY